LRLQSQNSEARRNDHLLNCVIRRGNSFEDLQAAEGTSTLESKKTKEC
jgi:hypothetical protein